MSRLFTILLLGLVGAVSLNLAFGWTHGPAQVSPYFLMAALVPLVLRQFDYGRTYWQMFVGCFSVGLIMTAAQLWWIASVLHRQAFVALPIALMVIILAFGSALVAGIAAPRPFAADSTMRRASRSLALSFVTFALTYGGLSLLMWRWQAGVLSIVSSAAVMAFAFAFAAVAVQVPALLLARRLRQSPLAVVAIGAALFPLPMLFVPFIQGRFSFAWKIWLDQPAALAWAALPYLAASAMLGWWLAAGPVSSRAPAPRLA